MMGDHTSLRFRGQPGCFLCSVLSWLSCSGSLDQYALHHSPRCEGTWVTASCLDSHAQGLPFLVARQWSLPAHLYVKGYKPSKWWLHRGTTQSWYPYGHVSKMQGWCAMIPLKSYWRWWHSTSPYRLVWLLAEDLTRTQAIPLSLAQSLLYFEV